MTFKAVIIYPQIAFLVSFPAAYPNQSCAISALKYIYQMILLKKPPGITLSLTPVSIHVVSMYGITQLSEKKNLDHLPVTGVLLLGNLHRSTFFEVIVNASRTKEPLKFPISGRKPRPVSQLVAQQVTQQFVPPTQSKKEKKDKVEKEKSEKETTSKKNSHKKTRPRLKNVDRSSAQHLEVTVGDLTVIITDFKEKTKSPPASSAASADQHSQSGSSSDNTERGMSRSSSPRGEASSLNGESH
ncbi:YY1-associated factor 2 [Marmota marmota marmota]|uniref:YY1-associated factor 2 n=1 Tax=Marmota marmota marmota TaxID=9994 RepID=UPI0020926EAA|nr:YY1-associated factor 2 [Marmota marmota marmota]